MKEVNLKNSTINGFAWSFIDNLSRQIASFIVGIVLARLLLPSEFGLIGLLMVVIAVSQAIIDSGLTQALIRKKECTSLDYSTVFIFNLILSIFIYGILFFGSPFFASYFNEPKLELLTKVLGLGVVLGSLSIIQRVKLTRDLNFKLQTKITLVATIVSGGIGVYMAYEGFGVWSLVARILVEIALISLLLIFFNRWIPSMKFSFSIFKDLFSYSNKLLLSSLLDTVYKNIYFMVIGKNFSTTTLGFYTRAQQFQKLPTQNLTSTIQRVSFPLLSKMQDDPIRLRGSLKKLITHSMFISFSLTLGLAAIAESLIITTVGIKWQESVVFLQLLCIAGMLYPMQAINLNVLNVLGYSSKFLKIEIVKKLLVIPIILLGIKFGMLVLLGGMIFNSLIGFVINSMYSSKLVNYSTLEQLRDISRPFMLSLVVSLIVFCVGYLIHMSSVLELFIQVVLGIVLTISFSEVFKLPEYMYFKKLVLQKVLPHQKSVQNQVK